LEELAKVPYLTYIPTDGRSVSLQPFFDAKDNSWKQFVPQGAELTWIYAEPVESSYFSERIADPRRDAYVKVSDIIARYYSYQPAMDIRFQITTRLIYSAIALEKYFLSLIRYRETKDPCVADLVITDLEYLFANARIVYDLIQTLFSFLWEHETGKKMKGSFREIVQKSGDQLRAQYGLPEPIISYYASSRELFFRIRAVRDAIFHFSAEFQPQRFVFCDLDGFAVLRSKILSDPVALGFDIWLNDKIKPNGLVSVLALIAYVDKIVVENTDRFSDALIQTIHPPRAITESHKLFLRSPYVHQLLKTDEYIREQWVNGSLESRLSHGRN
jgi:hypothetical protein